MKRKKKSVSSSRQLANYATKPCLPFIMHWTHLIQKNGTMLLIDLLHDLKLERK